MCKFKSVVLLKTDDKVRLYHSLNSDSHAEIIRANAEKFAGVSGLDFASLEILDAVIVIDEATKQDWVINYVRKHEKALFRFRAKHEKVREREEQRASFISSLKTAQDPRSYKRFEYGKWYSSFKTFRISDTVLAEILWCVDPDCDYCHRRYGRPKETYYGREVEFSVLGKTGVEKMSYPLDSFRGNFLEKAIKWFNERS